MASTVQRQCPTWTHSQASEQPTLTLSTLWKKIVTQACLSLPPFLILKLFFLSSMLIEIQ